MLLKRHSSVSMRLLVSRSPQLLKFIGVGNKHQFRMASMLINDPKYAFLKELGLKEENDGVFHGKWGGAGPVVESVCPSNNKVIAKVRTGTVDDYNTAVANSKAAWEHWAEVPAPARGQIVRQIGEKLRQNLQNLGKLVNHFFIMPSFT